VVPIGSGSTAIGGNLQLNLNSFGTQTLADNVRVDFTAVPEPTSLTLALAAAGLLTVRSRRGSRAGGCLARCRPCDLFHVQPRFRSRRQSFSIFLPILVKFVPTLSFPAAGLSIFLLCLGDLPSFAGEARGPITIEGGFGRVELDADHPGLVSLTLRRPDGTLEPQSLLADARWPWVRPGLPWAYGACTYAITPDGRRFDSRQAKPEGVSNENGKVTIKGVTLRETPESEPVAREDWTLKPEGNGLAWTVSRTWLRPLEIRLEGMPAVFMSMRGLADKPTPNVPNGVVSTLWVDPGQIAGRFDPIYRPETWHGAYLMSRNNVQWLRNRDQWAIHKLFTNWEQASDLRLDPTGGHLYRRGFMGWLTETGIITDTAGNYLKAAGASETTTLRIAPVDKRATGYQLAVDIPDKPLQDRLGGFYSSLMNGGLVNDQVNYNFGNETDGWYYGGSVWLQAVCLASGMPAPGALAQAPHDLALALRGHLAAIMGTVDKENRSTFGYNATGLFLDDNVNAVIGMLPYYLHTGDAAFVRQHLPILERMLNVYISRRNADGLFDLGPMGHQYYDVVPTSGVNAYHNALFYRALLDMAQLQRAVREPSKADGYERMAGEVKTAFNRVLWAEDAPGGPRYLDWITHTGEKVNYCADYSQFPPIAFGIASPEQGRKILATIDARIEELKKSHNYAEASSLSAYWPQPPHLQFADHTFPIYMNGGGFFLQTYWEIMARIRQGDKEGALRRLRKFAQGSAKYNWVGNNWVAVDGNIGFGGQDEPYLTDMVVVPAAIVNGFLGIRHTLAGFEVAPNLPDGWDRAEARLLHLGKPFRVSIANGKTRVEQLDAPVFTPPETLTWDVSARGPKAWNVSIQRYFDSGDQWSADESLAMDNGGGLRLLQDIPAGTTLGLWDFRKTSGDSVPDLSGFGNPAKLTSSGSAGLNVETDAGTPLGITMAGATSAAVPEGDGIEFKPGQSFTLEARFRTTSNGSGVLAARNLLFCMTVKEGRLAAWLMDANNVVAEAYGSTVVNDGKWHEAKAVFDYGKRELSIMVDGVLDGNGGMPGSKNPVSFSHLGAPRGPEPLTLGSLAGSYFFNGTLQSVALRSGLPTDTSPAKVTIIPAAGTYVSEPFNWNQPVRLSGLRTEIALNGGSVDATVETSDDGFATMRERIPVSLKDGDQLAELKPEFPARFVRLRLKLNAPADRSRSPVVTKFVLSGLPASQPVEPLPKP